MLRSLLYSVMTALVICKIMNGDMLVGDAGEVDAA
jgi:hypothetical protein